MARIKQKDCKIFLQSKQIEHNSVVSIKSSRTNNHKAIQIIAIKIYHLPCTRL